MQPLFPDVQAHQWIQAQLRSHHVDLPQIALILGSGLGDLAQSIRVEWQSAYREIPGLHATTVAGHSGNLMVGKLWGTQVICFQGRFHRYEGLNWDQVVAPARIAAQLGVQGAILTNAAGGIREGMKPGDLMIIEDHLNLIGDNPLLGSNRGDLGARFPDLSEPYLKAASTALAAAAKKAALPVHAGIYVGVLGPSYETPAEIRMYRGLGGDAVGMSTVAETIALRHASVRVAAVSCITNLGSGMAKGTLTHDDVMEVSQKGAQRLMVLLETAWPALTEAFQSGR